MTTERLADTSTIPTDPEEAALAALEDLDAPTGDAGRMEALGDGRFRLADAGQADWALRKLARVTSRLAEVHAVASRQRQAILDAVAPHLRMIDDWATEEEGRISGEIAHWEGLLVEYHRSVLSDDPKGAKTIRLPHGTLSARKLPDHWEFTEEFEGWAKGHRPDLLRTEVTKPEAKKAIALTGDGTPVADVVTGPVTEDGAIPTAAVEVPGVTVTLGEVRFSVSTEEVAK